MSLFLIDHLDREKIFIILLKIFNFDWYIENFSFFSLLFFFDFPMLFEVNVRYVEILSR